MIAIVLDIEAVPDTPGKWTELQKARWERETNRIMEREGREREDAARLAGSINPYLGRIICISVQVVDKNTFKKPKSYVHQSEKQLLDSFWRDMSQGPPEGDVLWVTFGGKRFDVPFILGRSLKHGCKITRRDLLQDSPYSNFPHLDIAGILGSRFHYSLAETCDFMGVKSPKNEVDGSKVWDLWKEGKLDEIIRYCEGDVASTGQLYKKVRWGINIFPWRRPRKNSGNWKGGKSS